MRVFLSEEIAAMVRSQLKLRSIFWHRVDLLIRDRVQVPGYFRLAELILAAINHRKQALTVLIEQTLPAATRKLLDALFVQSASLDGEPVETKTAACELTLLKQLSQSTNRSKIKERVADLEVFEPKARENGGARQPRSAVASHLQRFNRFLATYQPPR